MKKWRHGIYIVIFATSALLTTTAVCSSGPKPGTKHRSPDDILMAVFSLPMTIDADYQKENKRLLALCKYYGSKCFSKHFKPINWKLAIVHEEPIESSKAVGEISAVLKVSGEEFGGLIISLDYTPHGSNDSASWISDVGDWGYGIHQYVMEYRNGWFRLSKGPFPAVTWIKSNNIRFPGKVSTIKGQLIHLEALEATDTETLRKTIIPKGNYLVQKITDGKITFRPEVPSDYPCGEDVEPPEIMPTSYETDRTNFFGPDDIPLFQIAYSRGC